jgi:hypothetical protein
MEIRELLASGFIGGSGQLFRIERLAWDCHAELEGSEKVICAGVAHLLDRIARRQEDEIVTADEAVRLCNKISQPLLRWLDAMMGKDSGAGPERLLGELNIAYDAGSADQVSR